MNDSSWTAALSDFASRAARTAAETVPAILGALALLVAGWLLALVVRSWSRRLIRGFIERFSKRPEIRGEMERTGMRRIVPDVTSLLLFWVVLLFFASAAIETLGLPVMTNLLSALASYLPNVVAALAIVFVGLLAAVAARSAIAALLARAQVPYAGLVGQIVQVAILLVALVTGIDQIGIDSTFLIIIVGISVATLLGAAALAFGLGARTEVSNILAAHSVQKIHRVGHSVRIGEIEGRVVQITSNSVILESGEDRIVIPARRFSEEAAIIREG